MPGCQRLSDISLGRSFWALVAPSGRYGHLGRCGCSFCAPYSVRGIREEDDQRVSERALARGCSGGIGHSLCCGCRCGCCQCGRTACECVGPVGDGWLWGTASLAKPMPGLRLCCYLWLVLGVGRLSRCSMIPCHNSIPPNRTTAISLRPRFRFIADSSSPAVIHSLTDPVS